VSHICLKLLVWLLGMLADEGGLWELYITFPSAYPAKPPDVRFVNRIHHCNINSQGKICHSILDRNWNPARSVRDVIDCIYGLLLIPEPDDPLDSTIAEEYYADKTAYEKNARDLVKLCAVEPKAAMERRLAPASEGDDAPDHLVCPLTKKLMQDPVLLFSAGQTFERAAITALLKNGGLHPLTKLPLVEAAESIAPNAGIAAAILEWKQSASVADVQWWD
jgi:hypothetical protein